MNAPTGQIESANTAGISLIDRLAEWLSLHVDDLDIVAGIGTELNPGGDIAASAKAIGISEPVAEQLFQRMCSRLGRQAT